MRLLLLGLAIGLIVYVASSGRVIFLPLLLVLPIGLLFRSRKRYGLLGRRRTRWPWQDY